MSPEVQQAGQVMAGGRHEASGQCPVPVPSHLLMKLLICSRILSTRNPFSFSALRAGSEMVWPLQPAAHQARAPLQGLVGWWPGLAWWAWPDLVGLDC